MRDKISTICSSARSSRFNRLISNNGIAGCLIVLILLIHAGLLAYSATRHSPTMNEPGHLVAGLTHWKFGRFEVYCVNPPLTHYVSAVPVIVAGYEEDWSGYQETPGGRPEYQMGEDFITANAERSIWLFTIARWACIPFSLIGGLFCFFWSRELWGNNLSGLISLFLWCFEPNILAHGELITPDCAATSLGVGAGYLFWRWLNRPNWKRALAAGIVLGIAQLAKTSWVILFGLWPILGLFWLFTGGRHDSRISVLQYISQLTLILFFALYVLNLGYGFDGSFTRLKDYTFVSQALTGLEKVGAPGNRFQELGLGVIPVPVPEYYLRGIDIQKLDFENFTRPSYLRGEWKAGGWWYYYVYGLAVKTACGTLCLLLLAIFTVVYLSRWRRRGNRSMQNALSQPLGQGGEEEAELNVVEEGRSPLIRLATIRDLVVLLTPAIVLLVLVSSQREFNHHVRYVLPVLGFLIVFVGVVSWWIVPAGVLKSK